MRRLRGRIMLVIRLSKIVGFLKEEFYFVYVGEKCSIWYPATVSSLTGFNGDVSSSLVISVRTFLSSVLMWTVSTIPSVSTLISMSSFSTTFFFASLSRHILRPFLANGQVPSSANLHSPHLGTRGRQIVCPN